MKFQKFMISIIAFVIFCLISLNHADAKTVKTLNRTIFNNGIKLVIHHIHVTDGYTGVYVTVKNMTGDDISISKFDFKAQNTAGIQKEVPMFCPAPGALDGVTIAPGAKISGNIYFDIPPEKIRFLVWQPDNPFVFEKMKVPVD